MDLSSRINSSVFHVYVRGLKRIACSCREEIHGVIVEEHMHRLRKDSLCPDCLAALHKRAGAWAADEQAELLQTCCATA